MGNNCNRCKKEISFTIRMGMKRYLSKKFCSKKCQTLSMIGVPHGHKTNDGNIGYWTDKKRLEMRSEKHPMWKGENASYRAKHYWIENKLGKPYKCEHCDRTDLKHRQYQWANISREYKRIETDWIRLCAKCHAIFDGNRGGKRIPQLALS